MSTNDRSEPPPGWRRHQVRSDDPSGWSDHPIYCEREAPELADVARAWEYYDQETAALRSEIESLRARLAAVGDQYAAERAARQALLEAAIDLKDTAVLEIEQAYGKRITPRRMDALIGLLRPVLEDADYKLKTWGPRAAMRLSFGRGLAEMALRDALDRMRGQVRRG